MRGPSRFLRSMVLAVMAAAVMSAALLLPAPALAGDRTVVRSDRLATAEARLLRDVNRIRVRNGRRPLRLDKRTGQAARARSADMATRHYFAHVEPDGDNARRILARRRIRASEVSENIGHTLGLTLRQGSKRMADWWLRSSPHRRQMLARGINYVGLGIARRGGRVTYTAIFTRSRDKTPPRVVIDRVASRPSDVGTRVTIDWHGLDPRLAKGTSGIRRFQLERFSVLGGWGLVEGDLRRSKWSRRTFGSGGQHYRLRAVDRAGNVGRWAYARVEIPARPLVRA